MSIDHLSSPHRVRKKYRIDRRAGAIVAVGPEVGVGIKRLARRRVTEPRLHRLDTLAMPDRQAGKEMPQLMKARPSRRARGLDGSPPHIPERGATDGIACGCDEHEPIAERREGAQVRGECIEHDLVGVSRPAPACERQRQLERFWLPTLAPGPEQIARRNDPAEKVQAATRSPEAMALLNLSRTQISELIRTSRLMTITQGRRRLVLADSITDCMYCSRSAGPGHGPVA